MPFISWRRKSYEVLPALSVRRRELRQSLRTVTFAWMFGIVWMSCAWGGHIKSFAKMLGFNDLAFGIMAAIPWAASFGQIISTVIIERTGLRKIQFMHVMTLSRLTLMLIPVVPLLLPVPSASAVVAMLCLMAASHFLGALGMPAWWSWMGDLIPRRIRGRYLAQRDRLTKLVQVFAVIMLAILLDYVKVEGAAETVSLQGRLMRAICIVFLVGGVFGVVDVLLFSRVREVIRSVADSPRRPAIEIRVDRPKAGGALAMASYAARYIAATVSQVLIDPLRDKAFRRFVLYGGSLIFAVSAGGWYWWLLAMDHLGFNFLATFVLYWAIPTLTGILCARMWGKLIDRWGRRPVLLTAAVGLTISVLPWFVVTPEMPCPQFVPDSVNWLSRNVTGLFGEPADLLSPGAPVGAFLLILVNCSLGGVFWSGTWLGQHAIKLGFSDGVGRSKYVAAAEVLISVGGILGGLVGGIATESLSRLQESPIGPFLWNNWHVAVAISLAARIFAAVMAARMPDPGSGSVREMFRLFGINTYRALTPRWAYPLRLIRWRRRNNKHLR